MTKKKKIFLLCIIGVLILFVTFGAIALATVHSNNKLNGTIKDAEEIVEGTGTYDWRKTTTFVQYGYTKDNPLNLKFYSNGKHTFNSSDDYINYIYFEESDSNINIHFDCEFDVSSAMEVFFVFDNGYSTSIVYIASLSRALGGTAVIKSEDINTMKAQGKDITKANIVEVWVKTLSGVNETVYRMMVHGQYVYTGTGEYDWRKSVVDIPFSSYQSKNDCYTEEIYSNGSHFFGAYKDYVKDIFFREKKYYTTICYTPICSLTDSMDVFFVFDNGYVTEIYRTYGVLCCFGGHIDIDEEDVKQLKADNAHIVEIWIRTND